jgi:hypothetical protein
LAPYFKFRAPWPEIGAEPEKICEIE